MNLRLIDVRSSDVAPGWAEYAFRRDEDDMYSVSHASNEDAARADAERCLLEYDEAPAWQKTKERTLIRVGAFYAGGVVMMVDYQQRRIEVCSVADFKRQRFNGERRVFQAISDDGPLLDKGWR